MDGAILRQHSGILLRATSATFTNGAAVLPPGPPREAQTSESVPLTRSQSRRAASREQVHERLVAELSAFIARWRMWLIIIALSLLVCLCVALYFYVMAVVAVVRNHGLPCDKPLKWYVIVGLLWAQFPHQVTKRVHERWTLGPHGSAVLIVAVSLPGWLIIGWGLWMVNTAKTCPNTNPGLFWPTKRFIFTQIGFAALTLMITVIGLFSLRRILLLIVASLSAKVGCEQAVHKLPKVPPGSPELVDAEDEQVMDCLICMETLASEEVVVRSPCAHFFHEQCLAKWCKNHLDCPLCRADVGEPDGEEQV